jgi:hypothetical protein
LFYDASNIDIYDAEMEQPAEMSHEKREIKFKRKIERER